MNFHVNINQHWQNFTLNECIIKHWSVCVCYERVKVLFIIQTTLLHYSKGLLRPILTH